MTADDRVAAALRNVRLRIWRAMCGDWWWKALEGTRFDVSDATLDRVDRITAAFQPSLCRLLGHVPEMDQCSLPEHDYCVCCNQNTPGKAKRR